MPKLLSATKIEKMERLKACQMRLKIAKQNWAQTKPNPKPKTITKLTDEQKAAAKVKRKQYYEKHKEQINSRKKNIVHKIKSN